MSRSTSRIATPDPSTYHLADQLRGRAIDSLYRLAEGQHTLEPIATHTITAQLTVHPWGRSAELRAVDRSAQLVAAAEATAANPLPAAIRSRIRSYQAGNLTWTNVAATITSDGTDPSSYVTFEATGRRHYQLRRQIDPDTYHQHWDLTIAGQPHPHCFPDPVDAAEVIHTQLEPPR